MEKKTGRTGVKKQSIPSKLCLKCNRVLPLSEFYQHRDWRVQSYRDVWCRECAAKHCHDKESLAQYCYENNRKWEDSFYDTAMKKAQYIQANNADYLDSKTSKKKKDEIAGRTAARQFFSMMNMGGFYGFVENVGGDGVYVPPPEWREDAELSSPPPPQKLEYSRKWRGHFTKEQIETLDEIYAEYEEDFVLDSVNLRDYARKVAKASLNADIAEDRMRRGEISTGDYKEVQGIFDTLSKSASFAASKRKPGETSGMGSLGEIILKIESTGKIDTSGFTWPQDSVDMALAEYKHTIVAVGAEGGFG